MLLKFAQYFFKLGTACYKQLIKENEGWTRQSEIFISLAV